MANLDIIRQAMQNNPPNLIGFNYTKETTGEYRNYIVEPYEIDVDNGIFWGYKINDDKPGIRKFYLANMVGEQVLSEVFNPRWPLYPYGK